MVYLNRTVWKSSQIGCNDLKRVHAHLTQGTRPTKKQTNQRDVKTYLQHVSPAQDGLLVATANVPFNHSHERIVVPRNLAHGLVTALHLRFNHPKRSQMAKLMNRYYFILDMDTVISTVHSNCQQCASLDTLPCA